MRAAAPGTTMVVFHTGRDEEVSTAVIRALEEVTGTPAGEATPLYNAVDPDALDALFRDRDTDDDYLVQFEHDGYRITVTGDAEVRIGDVGSPASNQG